MSSTNTASALDADLRETGIALLLEALYAHHGYDFREYSRASITRRVHAFMGKYRIDSISEIIERARRDKTFLALLISEISVTVTEMFRQPSVFSAFRDHALSTLASKPSLKVWVAGCATGEEAFSLAIVLEEAGLLERTQIYATDINPVSLDNASRGIIHTSKLKRYTANYHEYGGKRDFCSYFIVREEASFIEAFLKERILFTSHNLVHDGVFGDMDVIFCRNVMIYFTPELQEKVLALFLESLSSEGFLCLGSKESLYLSGFEHHFEVLKQGEKLYRRKKVEQGAHYVA